MKTEHKGLIQVYTGDGKGKTSAAIGAAIRARSHGLKVCWIYFHKDPAKWGNSEIDVMKKVGVDVFGFAQNSFFFNKNVTPLKMREQCITGLDFIKQIFAADKYDFLVLDEINISMRQGSLTVKEVITLLKTKPKHLDIVLTGRGAPLSLIKMADLVSRIKNIKHPYDKGIKAREGFEY